MIEHRKLIDCNHSQCLYSPIYYTLQCQMSQSKTNIRKPKTDVNRSNLSCENYYPVLVLLRPFNGLFSTTTWVIRYRKDKTSLDLNEARDYGGLGWQWHQLDHMQTICTSPQTDNHTSTSSLNCAIPDAQPTVSMH